MPQLFFLDTNVILDYVEDRNREVRDVVAQLLVLHGHGKLALATSVLNVAEMIDKEFDICFYRSCIEERMSYDEIMRRVRGDRKLYRELAQGGKTEIEKKVRDFLSNNDIPVLFPDLGDSDDWDELYELMYKHQLSSQDAVVVFTALAHGATYFLSNDSDVVNAVGADESLGMYPYSLRDKTQREVLQDTVLEAL